MARQGYKILDSDMHVYELHDLYLKYMNPKWGDRIPRAELRKRHGPNQVCGREWQASQAVRG